MSRQEKVSSASRVGVDVHGDGGGLPFLTVAQAFSVATVLGQATTLLQAAHAERDPVMGTVDEKWQRRVAEGLS